MTIYGQINTSQGQTAPPSSDTPTTLTDRGIDLNSAQFDLESNADSRADKWFGFCFEDFEDVIVTEEMI